MITQLPAATEVPPTPSRLPLLANKTPTTSRAFCRLLKASPSRAKLSLFKQAIMRLTTDNNIKTFENRGLRRAIVAEKTRRKRGGRLNLMGEVAGSAPQFFSPQKVIAARAYQEGKEAQEQEERRLKAQKKEETARRRQQIANDKLEARIQRELRQQASREAKAIEKAQKQAQREELRAQKALQKQEKAAAAAERKKEQNLQRQLLAAAKKAASSKGSKKRVPKVASKPVKKAVRVASKSSKSTRGSQNRAPSSKTPGFLPAATTIAVAATATVSRSRSGRNVVRPQRFEE